MTACLTIIRCLPNLLLEQELMKIFQQDIKTNILKAISRKWPRDPGVSFNVQQNNDPPLFIFELKMSLLQF